MKSLNPRRVYKISLEDESRLTGLCEWRFEKWRLWLAAAGLAVVMLGLSTALIMLTPLRTLLPGYLHEAQRDVTVDNLVRLDSLREAFDRNEAYLANVLTVFDTERQRSDSAVLRVNASPLTVDSLMARSGAEEEFVRDMEEREKYNISILAPLAAEGMVFNPVSDESVISARSRRSRVAEVVVASGSPVGAVTDGVVVDAYYSRRDGGYCILMQHGKGFVSRYSRLGLPLVERGDKLSGGQIVALMPQGTGRGGDYMTVEMWRNGDPLIPYRYLGHPVEPDRPAEPVVDEDIGRGR